MFDFITGKLSKTAHESVTIEVSGLGYKVMIPASCFVQLPSIGTSMTLYISFVIREFSQTLYGFLYESERNLFESLLSVTGIGPKLALSIIGHISSDTLRKALQEKDIDTLCKVPGIGKKTAERLFIELKDTLPKIIETTVCEHFASSSFVAQDAISALINLGYNQITAQKAVKKTMGDSKTTIDLASLITASLKNIS